MLKKTLLSLFFFSFFFVIAHAEESNSFITTTPAVASDRRLKKDSKPFTDGLNVITKLNPIHYYYNGKGGTPKDMAGIGLVAQDIKDIAPYTISTYKAKLNPQDKEETTLFNFNSGPLTFVLINAIKEQQQEIESLKTEIAGLKGKR